MRHPEEDYELWMPWTDGLRRHVRLPNIGMLDCLTRFLRYPFSQAIDLPLNFVDAGACVGAFVLSAKTLIPNATVLAFEPYPPCWPYLEHNVQGIDGVRLFKCALGNREGTVRIGKPAGATVTIGQTSLYGDLSKAFEVKIKRLDDVVQRGTIHLMKLDVEGAELDVLQGAERILRQDRPTILVEIKTKNQNRAGHKNTDVVDYLTSLGYGPQGMAPYGDAIFQPVEEREFA